MSYANVRWIKKHFWNRPRCEINCSNLHTLPACKNNHNSLCLANISPSKVGAKKNVFLRLATRLKCSRRKEEEIDEADFSRTLWETVSRIFVQKLHSLTAVTQNISLPKMNKRNSIRFNLAKLFALRLDGESAITFYDFRFSCSVRFIWIVKSFLRTDNKPCCSTSTRFARVLNSRFVS